MNKFWIACIMLMCFFLLLGFVYQRIPILIKQKATMIFNSHNYFQLFLLMLVVSISIFFMALYGSIGIIILQFTYIAYLKWGKNK